jgi:hypothetical protein
MRKRSAYRPKVVNAPVTGGLLSAFEECAQAVEIGLRIQPNAHLIDSALTMFNTVGAAATAKKIEREAIVAIQSAALHLGTVCERFGRSGEWKLTEVELAQVQRGAQECLRILGKLDVRGLMIAYKTQGAKL